jgi:hypothetical protein
MYQPVYLDQQGTIVSISQVIFSGEDDAKQYASLVCKRGQKIEIVEPEVVR